jgi:transposase-like protein
MTTLSVENHEISIPCPQCKTKATHTIGYFRKHSATCKGCGATVRVNTSEFDACIKKTEREIDRLKDSLKNLKL